ncbi:1-acyl-sn-glycerol-3-phosphate acyltransferase [Arenibacterium sp. CAU 1754]
MNSTVELPLWLFILILLFAAITFASHFLFPSVRWYFRRRLERVVARLNQRLERPIQPFKLARRYDMIQRLIYDPQVAQAVAKHAEAEGIPENVAFERARRYAKEIVPAFSASAYFGFAIRAAKFLGDALYRVRLGHFEPMDLSEIDTDATVVFVMNHRSNMDYVLVTYLAADRSALSYAVGEWAQVWPLSGLIRAMGAYFIRRKSRNELYRTVLARYVQLATQAGVTQAMFPEGGLSRTGALMPPKMGLLKYIIEATDPETHDVVFVPVALNYDRVLEDRALTAAAEDPNHRFQAGIGMIARSIVKQLWLRVSGRYHRFGYAAVSFGRPVSLREFTAGHPGDVTMQLAQELMDRIGAIVPVLPVPLVSWLVLENGAMTRAEVERGLSALLTRLPTAHTHLPRDNRDYGAEVGLRHLVERGVLREEGGKYVPDPAEMKILQYYANSIRHLIPGDDPGVSAGANEISAVAGS